MRSAIALCLLAVLCTIDATSPNIWLRKVQDGIRIVQGTIQQLERIRNNVEQDVNFTVMKKMFQQIEEYDNYVNPILEAIRKEVEEAKARGKDLQHCYDTALYTLRNLRYETDLESRRCQASAKISIKTNLCFINDLIATGHRLIEELNNIIPDCQKENPRIIDIIKLHRCILNQIEISKGNAKKLKTDASSAGSTAKSASNSVLQNATNCLSNSIEYSKISAASSDATRCLNHM